MTTTRTRKNFLKQIKNLNKRNKTNYRNPTSVLIRVTTSKICYI